MRRQGEKIDHADTAKKQREQLSSHHLTFSTPVPPGPGQPLLRPQCLWWKRILSAAVVCIYSTLLLIVPKLPHLLFLVFLATCKLSCGV